jgi:hypothetical protein
MGLGRKSETSPRKVRVEARSWESLAADEPLRFSVPPTAVGPNADGFVYWWKLIQYTTDVGDPTRFPPLPAPFGSDDERTLRRFVTTALDLSRSTALNYDASVLVSVSDDRLTEEVTADAPAADALAGFSVLLRQLYSQDERASFHKVYGLIARPAAAAGDEVATARREELARIRSGQVLQRRVDARHHPSRPGSTKHTSSVTHRRTRPRSRCRRV